MYSVFTFLCCCSDPCCCECCWYCWLYCCCCCCCCSCRCCCAILCCMNCCCVVICWNCECFSSGFGGGVQEAGSPGESGRSLGETTWEALLPRDKGMSKWGRDPYLTILIFICWAKYKVYEAILKTCRTNSSPLLATQLKVFLHLIRVC